MNELIKLDATKYGIEKSKAEQLEKVFVPMVEKFKELENEYETVLSNKEITKEVSASAKEVRLKYQKVRTGADKIHKQAKERLLVETRAIDGLRNIIKYAVIDHEESLEKVEKHFELLEAERKQKIREKRQSELSKYDANAGIGDIADMPDEVWNHYISSVKKEYEDRLEAERKADEERIAKEKAEREEQERIRKENEKLKKEAEKREKAEIERKKKEEAERKAREEKERKDREAYEAKLRKEREERERVEREERIKREKLESELKAKQEAERKAKEEQEAKIQAELNKGDSEKVKDLINDLNQLKSKYSFKSDKNKKMYLDVGILIDKVINHIEK